MGRDFTTAGLITSVARRAAIPINRSTFSPKQILAFGDDELIDTVLPAIRRHRGSNHFLASEDATTTTATSYDIPDEAANRGLHNVTMVDATGYEYALVPIDFDMEIDRANRWAAVQASNPDARRAYYVRGDKLYLYPASVAGETLRQWFERLPNRLCLSATYTGFPTAQTIEAVQVVSVNTSTGAITCTTSSVPSTVTTSTPIDVVKQLPGFTLRIAGATPTAVTTSVVTLGNNIAAVAAAGIVAGDWLCLAGDSPLVQIPVDCYPMLAQAVAVKVMEGLGDTEGMQNAQVKLKDVLEAYGMSFPNRVAEAPPVITSGNRLADAVGWGGW